MLRWELVIAVPLSLVLTSVMHERRNKHQVCFIKRRNEAQYSRMFIMDDEQSDVGHDGTGCTLLDNAGAYCPDARSALLRRRSCAECRITFDVAAPGESRGLSKSKGV
ncbi:hypothetical protein KO495_07410 [Colwellia sp. D2M02]|uniref:hypothetical protein n=1 Tax=Colwellia sp. D2M02 TaxID=2841562 RepID=UPI001C089FEB|nr:hypothetical protein [Colwellia sp. D2M02]MBU2893153.1 hypothetical protein [Colwellia sp. D2M02]